MENKFYLEIKTGDWIRYTRSYLLPGGVNLLVCVGKPERFNHGYPTSFNVIQFWSDGTVTKSVYSANVNPKDWELMPPCDGQDT
jgi:hypothetical protein